MMSMKLKWLGETAVVVGIGLFILMGMSISWAQGISDVLLKTITAGDLPNGVAVNPVTNRIYATNLNTGNVAVIDGNSHMIFTTIPVGVFPRGVGVNPTTNRVYVANSESDTVSVINGVDNTVLDTISVGQHPADQVGINRVTNRIYTPNFDDNTVSVIDGLSNAVVATIPVGSRPRGIAVDPLTNRIYVTNGFDDTLSVIDGNTNLVLDTIPVGFFPAWVAVNPDTRQAYVANAFDDTVSIIDTISNAVIATPSVGDVPTGVTIDPTTNLVYVTNGAHGATNGSVSVIDGTTHTVLKTFPVGQEPSGVTLNPVTKQLYAANGGDDTVTVYAPIINSRVALTNVVTSFDSSKHAPLEPFGSTAGVFTITATFKNTSAMPISRPFFSVTELTSGTPYRVNVLLNADRLIPGAMGSVLTGNVGGDDLLSPGEMFTTDFVIGLQSVEPFRFFVNLLEGSGKSFPLCGSGTNAQRFVSSADNTEVCDNMTGRYWEQTPSPDATLTVFTSRCRDLDLGNNQSYGTAGIFELLSLVDPSNPNPAAALNVPNGPFENVGEFGTWNNATGSKGEVWAVNFADGGVGIAHIYLGIAREWCVR